MDALTEESGRSGRDATYDAAVQAPAERIVTKIIFPVREMGPAISFYEAVGFEVEAFDESYAWVRHRGEEILHLALVTDLDSTRNAAAGYFHVQDPEAWHRACSAAVETGELLDRPWGMREFELRDPSRNLLRVGANL